MTAQIESTPKTIEERKAVLAARVAYFVTTGGRRVETQTDTMPS